MSYSVNWMLKDAKIFNILLLAFTFPIRIPSFFHFSYILLLISLFYGSSDTYIPKAPFLIFHGIYAIETADEKFIHIHSPLGRHRAPKICNPPVRISVYMAGISDH